MSSIPAGTTLIPVQKNLKQEDIYHIKEGIKNLQDKVNLLKPGTTNLNVDNTPVLSALADLKARLDEQEADRRAVVNELQILTNKVASIRIPDLPNFALLKSGLDTLENKVANHTVTVDPSLIKEELGMIDKTVLSLVSRITEFVSQKIENEFTSFKKELEHAMSTMSAQLLIPHTTTQKQLRDIEDHLKQHLTDQLHAMDKIECACREAKTDLTPLQTALTETQSRIADTDHALAILTDNVTAVGQRIDDSVETMKQFVIENKPDTGVLLEQLKGLDDVQLKLNSVQTDRVNESHMMGQELKRVMNLTKISLGIASLGAVASIIKFFL
jgi:hypothetical protein